MKTNSLLLGLLLTISSSIKAQTLTVLETKNGFKDFKLSSPINSLKSKLSFYNKDGNNISTYELKGELPSYNNLTPKHIGFDYYGQKLYKIVMYFKDLKGNRFINTSNMIETMYGKPTNYKRTITGGLYAEWESKSVLLSIQYIKSSDDFTVTYKSIPLERKILLDNN